MSDSNSPDGTTRKPAVSRRFLPVSAANYSRLKERVNRECFSTNRAASDGHSVSGKWGQKKSSLPPFIGLRKGKTEVGRSRGTGYFPRTAPNHSMCRRGQKT